MVQTWKNMALSFYSGHFYGEQARLRQGVGMRLILGLTLLMSFFMTLALVTVDPQLHAFLEHMPKVADGLPSVWVRDGKLSIDKPVPYRVSLSDSPDSPWIVIDTNYKMPDIDTLTHYMHENQIALLLTSDKAVVSKENKGEVDIIDLKQSAEPFTVTHEMWQRFGKWVADWGMTTITLVFFVTFFIVTFFYNLIATIVVAMIIALIGLITKLGLTFDAAMRLAASMRVPATILAALPMLLGFRSLGNGAVFGWILWLIYLVFALCSVHLYRNAKAS